MVETSLVSEGINPLERDPRRIHEGLWLAMSHGNKYAKMAQLPDIEEVLLDIHKCIMKPVIDPKYRYLLDEYRTREAIVLGGIVHPARWKEIPEIMREYSDNVNDQITSIKKMQFPAIANFIDLASYAHFQFYKTHPFLDGHKRTARQVVDTIAKHLGFESILIPINRKEEYLDAMQDSTTNRDIRHFSIFQAGLVAESYRGKKDRMGQYCFRTAMDYRAHLIREVRKSNGNGNHSEHVTSTEPQDYTKL